MSACAFSRPKDRTGAKCACDSCGRTTGIYHRLLIIGYPAGRYCGKCRNRWLKDWEAARA